MEMAVLITLTLSAIVTVLGCLARDTRKCIIFLSLQAVTIGFVELAYLFIELAIGLNIEALIDFLAAFAEWLFAAVVVPLILYWGMKKTENVVDKPLISINKTVGVSLAVAGLYIALWRYPPFSLPPKIDMLPFCFLMFMFSILLIVTRRDPLKILVGLNMAENAFYPLFAESPLIIIPFTLGLMVFITAVSVYVIAEAYRDYNTMSIDYWRNS